MSKVIKIVFKDEIRRVSLDKRSLNPRSDATVTFQELKTTIMEIIPKLQNRTFSVTYFDDEGDEVTISSDDELLEALKIAKKVGTAVPRFTVKTAGKAKGGSEEKPTNTAETGCDEDTPKPSVAEFGRVPVHRFVACDQCGMEPIVGVRYKCTVRDNYDICEKCEASIPQPFAMVKIPAPRMDPTRAGRLPHGVLHGLFGPGVARRPHGGRGGGPIGAPGDCRGRGRGCGYLRRFARENGISVEEAKNIHHSGSPAFGAPVPETGPSSNPTSSAQDPNTDDKDEMLEAFVEFSPFVNAMDVSRNWTQSAAERKLQEAIEESLKTSEPPKKPALRFVRDVTVPDGTVVSPGEVLIKTWRVRNDGDRVWPEGATLANAGGDEIQRTSTVSTIPLLSPGEEAEISVEVVAPTAPGRYVSYYRMQLKNEKYFGHRLWIDILVMNNSEEGEWDVINEQILTSIEVIPEAHQDIVEATEASSATASAGPAEVPIFLPSAPAVPEKWAKELSLLAEMGFVDKTRLVPLLETHIESSSGVGEEHSAEGIQRVVAVLLSESGFLN